MIGIEMFLPLLNLSIYEINCQESQETTGSFTPTLAKIVRRSLNGVNCVEMRIYTF